MQKRSFLCIITAIYDFCRFFVLLLLMVMVNSRPNGSSALSGSYSALGNLPFMLYVAPLALFPIMSLFLWYNFEASKGFIRLYITGKILSIVAAASWSITRLSPRSLFIILRYGDLWQIFDSCIALILLFGDILTIALISLVSKKKA